MNTLSFNFADQEFQAVGNGALYWPSKRMLIVSDLHLGKSERVARRSGQFLPPYETQDTLSRLADTLQAFNPESVVCLGDSFDDLQASQNLLPQAITQLNTLMAGRRWIWIEGNHDPGPVEFGGSHMRQVSLKGITLRLIAEEVTGKLEISGHYHPKTRLSIKGRWLTRPCFLIDATRVIMPSFGTYTGGLDCTNDAFSSLMDDKARAILTGHRPYIIPMPRSGG